MPSAYKLLQLALAVFGVVMLLLDPLALVWPSGWAWHAGAPYESEYFMMIVGVYATLGVFVLNAARNPQANVSLIWFTVCSSVVHAAIMAVQSFGSGQDYVGHLWGDVPALLLVAVVLSGAHGVVGFDAICFRGRSGFRSGHVRGSTGLAFRPPMARCRNRHGPRSRWTHPTRTGLYHHPVADNHCEVAVRGCPEFRGTSVAVR